MKRIDIYRAGIDAGINAAETPTGAELELSLASTAKKLGITSDIEYTQFYNTAIGARNHALACIASDKAAAAKPLAPPPVKVAAKLATLIVVSLLWVFSSSAAVVVTNTFNYQSVSAPSTNNGTAIPVGEVRVQQRQHAIQSAGVGNTNALVVNIQLSLDGSNWTTVQTYRPALTNARVDVLVTSTLTNTLWLRPQIVATNATSVGIQTIRQ